MADNEKDVGKLFRVESFTDEQMAGHVASLQAPLAQLHPNNPEYEKIKRCLQFAVEWRAQAADNLRHVAQIKISAGAKDGEFTEAYKNCRLQKLRSNLCKARELHLYSHVASTDGWQAAHEVRENLFISHLGQFSMLSFTLTF